MVERLFHPCRQYLDGVSTAYIHHIEEAVIHGVFISTCPVEANTVFEHFERTYLTASRPEFARFRQRVVRRSWFWPYWTDATATFDTAFHFHTRNDPITKSKLEGTIGGIQTEMLDFSRPLWELHHFGNFTDENGKACSATLLRMHHAMADGFTALRVLMQGAEPNKPPAGVQEGRAERRPRLNCLQILHFWLAAMRKLLLMQPDRPSTFKSPSRIGAADPKTVAWNSLRCASVADLKALGKELDGATVNDILLTALAGALRKYIEATPGAALPSRVTACAWVSLTPLRHVYSSFAELPLRWGNGTLGAVYIVLPVGAQHRQAGPRETLRLLRERTEDPALMLEAGMATKLLSLLGWVPRLVGGAAWGPLANKVSVSMSNMPGPQFELEWCGSPVRSMLFFVPPTGTISLFVTIATFNGEVSVGMAADATLLGPEALGRITGELFEAEIRQLRGAAGEPASEALA